MSRICYIEKCYQCRYCIDYINSSEYSYDREGFCNYFGDDMFIEDVCGEIPEWCELEIKEFTDEVNYDNYSI